MTIHLIPGIGGTSDMFRDYHFPFPVQRLDYFSPPSQNTSFADYARQFAARHQIEAGDCLVGMSMGGMLACEISKTIPICKLILISSGTRPEHINPLLRRFSVLAPAVPFAWFQRIARPSPLFGSVRQHAVAMFKASDPNFLSWSCYHAARWDGLDSHSDLTQIHGSWDPVFPLRKQRPQHVLPRGDHIVLLRRPHIINLILTDLLEPLVKQQSRQRAAFSSSSPLS